jgi:DNA-binding LacI/PurR family transcriptional regulator
MRLLIDQIDGTSEAPPELAIQVPARLLVRESTAAPRPDASP